MENPYPVLILKYSIVLGLILSTLYTAVFYREVFAKEALISRFIGIFIFSSVLFLFLNKAVGWEPREVFYKTVKFFLILSAIFTVIHVIYSLSQVNLTGLPLLAFIVLMILAIVVLISLIGMA